MLGDVAIEDLFNYFLKRESTQFFVSIAIRSLAMGMVAIFEPVYLYIYFGYSIAHVLFFWAAVSGIFALIVVFGGKVMEKIGLKKTMLFSNFFYFAFYICLFFAHTSFIFLPLAIIARAIGASLFWPAFHTDFIRFTKGEHRARGVSKMSIISLCAGILSPVIGGFILAGLGYASLFVIVLITLFTSSFPLFLSKERYEVYTDTYKRA
ncbi:MFS transporter, partial [Patescibacteria group bacterium]|nr:MFS transporter [Patescibacteria group bacterium]